MAEVRYDTAGVSDGKGILAIQRSFGICGSSLREKKYLFTEMPILDFKKCHYSC
jgi:hypothetical protein